MLFTLKLLSRRSQLPLAFNIVQTNCSSQLLQNTSRKVISVQCRRPDCRHRRRSITQGGGGLRHFQRDDRNGFQDSPIGAISPEKPCKKTTNPNISRACSPQIYWAVSHCSESGASVGPSSPQSILEPILHPMLCAHSVQRSWRKIRETTCDFQGDSKQFILISQTKQ